MKTSIVGALRDVPKETRSLVRQVLGEAARELALDQGEVAIRFVDPDEMQALNKAWRAKNYPTDVLSFPSEVSNPEGVRFFGDLAICYDVACRQARRRRHSPARETALLALHGMLHLLGYDHESDDGEMDALERTLRRRVLPPRDAC